MNNLIILCGLLLASPLSAQQATPKTAPENTVELTVVVHNIKHAKGQITVRVFNTAASFPKGRPFRGESVKAQPGSVILRFKKLPPGTYAVAAFHDEDNNGTLTRSFFGPPIEPLGSSNNAKGHFGPPSFADAAIRLALGHPHTERIKID